MWGPGTQMAVKHCCPEAPGPSPNRHQFEFFCFKLGVLKHCLTPHEKICMTCSSHFIHPHLTRIKYSYLPAFLTNPISARTSWQRSQQKHSGCQLLFMALITRPMMNSPAWKRHTKYIQCGILLLKAAKGKKHIHLNLFPQKGNFYVCVYHNSILEKYFLYHPSACFWFFNSIFSGCLITSLNLPFFSQAITEISWMPFSNFWPSMIQKLKSTAHFLVT